MFKMCSMKKGRLKLIDSSPVNLSLLTKFILLVLLLTALGCNQQTSEIPQMSSSRWGHSSTLLEDGRVLVVGGKEKSYGSIGSAEIFDPKTASWLSAGNTLTPRGEGHTATLLSNGKVLITGGSGNNSSELYDPSQNSWSYTGNMNQPRKWASANLLEDGRILVAGGDDSSKTGSTKLNSSEIYNPSKEIWIPTYPMNYAHSGHSTTFINEKLLLVGKDDAELFDPSSETWSPAGKPVRARTTGSTATTMSNGKILITGGEWLQGGFLQGNKSRGLYTAGSIGAGTGNDGGKHPKIHMPIIIPIPDVDLYDPDKGKWEATNPMSEARRHHVAIPLNDGRVIIVGSNKIEAFDPDTSKWSQIGHLIHDHGESYTATLLQNGKLLVIGGKLESEKGDRGSVVYPISALSSASTELFEILNN